MLGGRNYRALALFISLYLLLSLPPFFALNWEAVRTVYGQRFPPDGLLLAGFVVTVVVLLAAIVLAEDGIDRYNSFVTAPSDLLSILIGSSFLWAAISWWFLPELVFIFGLSLPLNVLLVLVLVSQLPMLLFLAMLTAIGRASSSDTPR